MGEFEQVVLLAILQRGNDAYGMELRDEIAARTGRDVSIGALYRTLARLERKGYVSHSMGEPQAQRGGRAKKYFRVESAGEEALAGTFMTLQQMWRGLEPPGGGRS
jgi:DNA-binding PadR family transcriptional regulator